MEACNSASVMGGRAGSSPMVHKAHTFLMCLLVRDVKVGKILRHGGQKAGRVSNYNTNHDRSDLTNQEQIFILYTAFLVATSIAWVLIFCGYLYVNKFFFPVTKTKHY